MGLSECWKRRHAIAGGLLLGLTIALSGVAGAQEVPQQARAATGWSIPSDEVIRALLRERMAANGVGIVVGIVGPDGRRVITHGRSGAPDGRPLDGDTIFQIGSVTKVFTTLLLSKMALDGEVGIEDAAAKYLPAGTRMPEKGSPITLADLATHMSGLPSMPTNFDLSARPDPVEAYSADDLAAFLATYSPEREPGAAYAYSNLGVALLGRLLSAKAGRPYEQLLRESVLQPLGLADTSISLSADFRIARSFG